MNELIFIVEESPEGGFTARALGESIFTESETLEELRHQVRDAIRCHYVWKSVSRVASIPFADELCFLKNHRSQPLTPSVHPGLANSLASNRSAGCPPLACSGGSRATRKSLLR
jgi:hypothetical protein